VFAQGWLQINDTVLSAAAQVPGKPVLQEAVAQLLIRSWKKDNDEPRVTHARRLCESIDETPGQDPRSGWMCRIQKFLGMASIIISFEQPDVDSARSRQRIGNVAATEASRM
jgi:hypothetical protein